MSSIGVHTVIAPDAVIGANVTIGCHVIIYPGTQIGDGCTLFDGAVIGRPPKSAGTLSRPLKVDAPLIIGPGCVIGANAVLYAGTWIDSNVLIGDLASIREGCQISAGAVVGRGVLVMYETQIGERTRVIDGAILTGNMIIESDVFIGPGVNTVNDNDVYLKRYGLAPFSVEGPIVRRFALIGTGANLAAGVEIGMGAIVAPSAMVTKNVEAWSVVAGVPAKVIREVDPAQRAQILSHFGMEP